MTKRAIVLGGGGARGPYQIGVWKALRELELTYQIITGSSVGALNGAYMVQDDYELAHSVWESMNTRDIIADGPELSDSPVATERLSFIGQAVTRGGLDISPLETILRDTVNEQKIRESDIEYGIVTAKFPLLQPVKLLKEEIPDGELVDYMLASASWFPFFQRRNIHGVEYIDGAYADNLPAELAAKCGATEIIAIDLQGTGIIHTFRKDIPVRHIRSHWNLGDMMVFGGENAKRNIRMGYLDGLKAYHKLEGNAYAFYLGETRKNAQSLRGAFSRIGRRTSVSLLKQYQMLPRIQDMLRYRSIDHRFLHRQPERCTPGRAITTAAEIAGELLRIPPDDTYTFRQFNRLLLERIPELRYPSLSRDINAADAPTKRPTIVLRRLYRMLRDSYIRGRVPATFWRMAAVSPVEFVAATYLLALELHYRQDRRK